MRRASSASFENWGGRVLRRLRRRRNAHCINILTYHSVDARPSPLIDIRRIQHRPAEFERHIEYLAANYRFVRLGELLSNLEAGRAPRRAVVLTFDDGYADILASALPILHRRRIPAAIFPVTAVIGNRDLIWMHKLSYLVSRGEEARVWAALQAEGYPPARSDEPLTQYARRCFRENLPELLEAALRSIGTSGPVLAGELRPYLDWSDVADANPDLIEFGNHTHTHPVLSALPEAAQREEIATAADVIRSLTGRSPVALAYPFGLRRHYNQTSVEVARQTGHRAALDVRRRINTAKTMPLDLSRKPAAVGSQRLFERIVEDWPIVVESTTRPAVSMR